MKFIWLLLLVAAAGGLPLLSRSSHAAAIYQSGYIKIGGIEQWVQIRGEDEDHPVLFWLNGGPGYSTIPDTPAFRAWEKPFTVVMWDQRGEGKTFEKYGRSHSIAVTMTIQQMTEDGIEVAEYLHRRLPRTPIILLGHSWGSILGIHMIRSRPDLFGAYVGTGQVVSLPRQFEAAYPLLLKRATQLGDDKARKELLDAGPPSVSNQSAYEVVNKWGERLQPPPRPLPRPAAGSPDIGKRMVPSKRPSYLDAGRQFSVEILGRYLPSVDLPALGTDFKVPIFFFQGDSDFITTTSIVYDYYDEITAPTKKFLVFPRAGHDVVFRVRKGFLDALVKWVKPVVSRQ